MDNNDNPLVLNNIGALTATVTGFSFVGSLAYDYGFLHVLFDHVKCVLIFIPIIFIGIFLGAAQELFTRRVEE